MNGPLLTFNANCGLNYRQRTELFFSLPESGVRR